MGEVCFKVIVIIFDWIDTLYLHASLSIEDAYAEPCGVFVERWEKHNRLSFNEWFHDQIRELIEQIEVCFKVIVIIFDWIDTLYLHASFAIAFIESIYILYIFICRSA